MNEPHHLPSPSTWPATVGAAVTLMAFGITTSLALSALGVLLLAIGLYGWIHGCGMTDEQTPAVLSRRRFLNRMSLALSGLAAAVVTVPIVAYLLSPLLRPRPEEWRNLGPLTKFKIGETVEVAVDEPSSLPWAGQTSQTALWLRRTGESDFTAFGLNCTHLGCPVNWRAGAELFLCPCHGGVYYADGSVAGGPPPRPLVRYEVRIGDGQQVQVLTRALQQTITQG